MAQTPYRPVERAHAEAALAQILKSSPFTSSSQLSDILTYIVTKTLAGQEDEIKAYTIAVDALGKREDFDPQTNAAVRVAAGRLRKTLALYNAHLPPYDAARTDEAVIMLEPGSYVPAMHYRSDIYESDLLARAEVAEAERLINSQPVVVEKPSPADPDIETSEEIGGADGVTTLAAADGAANTPSTPRPVSAPFMPSVTPPARRKWPMLTAIILAAVLLGAALASLSTIVDLPQRINAFFNYQAVTDNRNDRVSNETQTGATPTDDTAVKPALKEPVMEQEIDVNRRPKVALTIVFSDPIYPDWFKRGEVEDSIVLVMTRFDDYQFMGVISGDNFPLNDSRQYDYHLIVSAYNRDERVRIFGRLIRQTDGTVLWSTQNDFDEPEALGERNVPEIAGRTYAPIGSPYGVIHADLMTSKVRRRKLDCVLATYQYFADKSDEKHFEARECAEKLRDGGSQLPSIYSALTFLYLDEYRERRNVRTPNALKAAERMALLAVQFGPQSARAQQALFGVYKVLGKYKEAEAAALRALELNPYDTTIIGDYAAWLVSVGNFGEARNRLDEMVRLFDSHPQWIDVFRFLAYELDDQNEVADSVATLIDYRRSPMSAASVAIGAHRTGKMSLLRRSLASLEENDPLLYNTPLEGLKRRGFTPGVAKLFADRIIAAQAALEAKDP